MEVFQKHQTKAFLREVSRIELFSEEERNVLIKRYENGDELAAAYLAGNAVRFPEHKDFAVMWINKLIDSTDKRNSAIGLNTLADWILTDDHPNFERDTKEAIRLLELASEKGSKLASEELASIYIIGDGLWGSRDKNTLTGWGWLVKSKPWYTRMFLSIIPLAVIPEAIMMKALAQLKAKRYVKNHFEECKSELESEKNGY